MSAEFESGFFVKEPAWHRLGTVLDDAPKTSEEAIVAAGLDWEAKKQSLFLSDGTEVPDCFAVVRNSDNSVLGTVGNRYTILQNKEAFSFFDPIIEQGIGEYETAGSLFDGKSVWILAKISGDMGIGGNDDIINKYILLNNRHDGKGTVVAKITPIRVVCNNTLTAALRLSSEGKRNKNDLSDEVKIRHTKSVGDRTKEASKLLKTINETYERLEKIWTAMAELALPPERTFEYVQRVLPDPENVENPHRTQTKRAEIHQLISDSSLGGQLDSAKNTLWGAYNGITAYTSHIQSKRKDATEDKHFDSLFFGQRQNLVQKAQTVALEFLKEENVSIDL